MVDGGSDRIQVFTAERKFLRRTELPHWCSDRWANTYSVNIFGKVLSKRQNNRPHHLLMLAQLAGPKLAAPFAQIPPMVRILTACIMHLICILNYNIKLLYYKHLGTKNCIESVLGTFNSMYSDYRSILRGV